MSGHLVHLASPAICAGSVIRQRCGWCGALLHEMDVARVAFPVGQEPELFHEDGSPRSQWQGLVAVEEGLPTAKWAVPDPEDGKIPPDSCMALDPAVTG